MSFRRRLRTPSFRRVRFNVFNTERGGGRNVTTHEFVSRDTPYSEDPTRQPKTYAIDGFVSGFDYQRQRDRLITALEAGGPGELVHPYYGSLQVVVLSFRVRESGFDGGMARFDIQFQEAGSLLFPIASIDAGGIFARIKATLEASATAKFLNDFSIAAQPQFVVDSARANVLELTDLLESQTNFITRNSDEIADLASSIEDLKDDVDTLLNAPSLLAQRMTTSLDLLSKSVTSRRESSRAYRNVFAYGSGFTQPTFNTQARIQERQNQRAFELFVRSIAAVSGAQSAVGIDFDSIEEAKDLSGLFFSEIDRLILELDDDPLIEALEQAKAQLAKAIPPTDQNLTRVVSVFNQSTAPALVIAYRIFGDIEDEADIIARNRVVNPNFVPGGRALGVLSRE